MRRDRVFIHSSLLNYFVILTLHLTIYVSLLVYHVGSTTAHGALPHHTPCTFH